MFIGISFYGKLMGKPPSYFRKKTRDNYKLNKEVRKRYNSMESHPGETFSAFKKRIVKKLGTKS